MPVKQVRGMFSKELSQLRIGALTGAGECYRGSSKQNFRAREYAIRREKDRIVRNRCGEFRGRAKVLVRTE